MLSPRCFLPTLHAFPKEKTKPPFVLTFLRMRYYMNSRIKRRPRTWAVLIIGTMKIPSFPSSCLHLNRADNLFSPVTTWRIVVTCTIHSLLKIASQNALHWKREKIIYSIRVILNTLIEIKNRNIFANFGT